MLRSVEFIATVLRQRLRTASSILAILAALACASPAAAVDATVAASEMNGFGRFVFSFSKDVKAEVRASSGVVVLSFDEQVNVDLQKLASQVPGYVSVIRRDPDGKTIRFATTRPLRAKPPRSGVRRSSWICCPKAGRACRLRFPPM